MWLVFSSFILACCFFTARMHIDEEVYLLCWLLRVLYSCERKDKITILSVRFVSCMHCIYGCNTHTHANVYLFKKTLYFIVCLCFRPQVILFIHRKTSLHARANIAHRNEQTQFAAAHLEQTQRIFSMHHTAHSEGYIYLLYTHAFT